MDVVFVTDICVNFSLAQVDHSRGEGCGAVELKAPSRLTRVPTRLVGNVFGGGAPPVETFGDVRGSRDGEAGAVPTLDASANVPRPEPTGPARRDVKRPGNMLIKGRHAIAKRYLSSWFLVDIASSLPFDLFTMVAGKGDLCDDSLQNLKVIRIVRLLRLVKLVRVIRASRIVSRWESSFSVSYAHLTILRLSVLLVTAAHWMACLWGLAAQKGKWSWMKLLELKLTDTETGRRHFVSERVGHAYVASLYFTVYTVTSVGYGDVAPATRDEMAICTVFILIGSVLWAYIIGNFASLLSSVDIYGAQFRQSMDELNVMMRERNFPLDLRRRCRTFFRQSRHMARVQNYSRLESMMSYALRGEAAAANNSNWLHRVWYGLPASRRILGVLDDARGLG